MLTPTKPIVLLILLTVLIQLIMVLNLLGDFLMFRVQIRQLQQLNFLIFHKFKIPFQEINQLLFKISKPNLVSKENLCMITNLKRLMVFQMIDFNRINNCSVFKILISIYWVTIFPQNLTMFNLIFCLVRLIIVQTLKVSQPFFFRDLFNYF